MRKKLVKNVLANVNHSYAIIANHFAQTRVKNWPQVDEMVKKYVHDKMKVLEVGCGAGRLVNSLADISGEISYVGLDNNLEFLKIAKKKFGHKLRGCKITWRQAELFKTGEKDNSVDVVLCIAALHHIPSAKLRKDALAEWQRILKPGGILIMTNWWLLSKEAEKRYKLKRQKLPNRLFGYDKGDYLIPWKNSEGKIIAKRYYHAFTLQKIEGLLKQENLLKIENKLFTTGFSESILTIAKKKD
ncbi:MAG: class I SAM-dependent methyltransferase [bacterium]